MWRICVSSCRAANSTAKTASVRATWNGPAGVGADEGVVEPTLRVCFRFMEMGSYA